ncbi:MAG: HAMP domain-containing sensor histidine kinase [Eubacteriales bacterium]|nr:HAMP domain-containing sensor histidine kinase [Eubacteriales bacterium]
MTAKKIFRSSAAKLLAFLVIIGCAAAALIHAEYTLVDWRGQDDNQGMVYRFEDDFSDSYLIDDLMNELTSDLQYALERGMDRQTFETEFASKFPGDYYGRMGDTVLGSEDLTENEALSSRFYVVARPHGGMQFNYSIRFGLLEQYYTEDAEGNTQEKTFPDNTIIIARLTEEQAAPYYEAWNEQKAAVMATIRDVLFLIIAALAIYIYLLFVTGRSGEDEQVHLVTIDRLFVEFNLLLLFGVPILAGAANIACLYEILSAAGSSSMMVFLAPSIALFTGAIALAVELSLSLVRNLKNRTFVARSFILRACKWCWKALVKAWLWCWNTIKRIWFWFVKWCKKAWHALGTGKDSIWNALAKDYKTRNVLLIFLGYTVVLALLACLFGATMDYGEGGVAFVLGVVWFGVSCAFVFSRVTGFEKIVQGLKRLRGGELTYKIEAMPAGVFAGMADDLNSLGDGMQAALQNEIRAERMKSELITNVSHDLKTPLTSIINYSDLLCKEHLSPEEANDYAKIIYQKSNRLKNLTSDLFDISKVQSGVETVDSERLDVCTLVRQALAEHEQAVGDGKLTLKVEIPEHEVPIWADGKKMSRVMENLIGNCVKYAMPGTRVFITVAEPEDRTAVIELKNIANYAMDFDAGEITERFVRGDAARSTEGSGLGLAIAKSYVTACGGTLAVDVDGDLFKVRISFPLYQ